MRTMRTDWFPWVLCALAGCSDSSSASDAAADVVDVTTDVATDTADPACPPGPGRPSGACAREGQVCAYNDPRPECGGVRMVCRSGQWAELKHTDPAASCFDAAVPDVLSDASLDVARDSSGDVASDVASRDATEVGDAAVNPCATAGGVCVANAPACAAVNGTASTSGAAGCHFDDGDGVCCVPPAPLPTGDACAARGGVCAPIAGCNFVRGSFGPSTGSGCTGVGVVCCLPHTICGDEDVVCCGATASFRPACDRGAWRCTIDGTTLVPTAMCRF